ncbi:MAG: hypothetical protein A2W28_11805 [Gammaproteobacteria bacterium RBG_16_51_14]|nr:MAG: hypothetical protein A2W28_11805 [Gammaproteobacteria bacterium RBG_16_51_14]
MPRKSRFILAVLLASLHLLLACSDDIPAFRKLPQDAVILAFGDSLTYGTGANPADSYPAVLEKLSGHKVINAGVPGELSEQGLKRLPGLLQQHTPGLLILCHAGNDLLRKKDLNHARSNLAGMIALAQERKIDVILLGVPQPGLFLNSSKIYREVAGQTRVLLLEDLVPEILGDASLKSDPVHPNKAGYRKIAEGVLQTMTEAGAL